MEHTSSLSLAVSVQGSIPSLSVTQSTDEVAWNLEKKMLRLQLRGVETR